MDIMRADGMKNKKRGSRGFTLIASLLMMVLLSGIAIGLMMMVNTEGKVGSTDMQNNLAYHAAEGGIEKMYSDLATVFQNAQSPTPGQICAVGNSTNEPSMVGVTWTQYSVMPGTVQQANCPAAWPAVGQPGGPVWGQITSGPDQGLWAQVIPVNMLVTASMLGGQEVSMTRTAQVALIPVFQYGVFCEGDCGFFDSPNLTFTGRVHTNADLYLGVSGSSTLTFSNRLEAYGNVVTEQLPNGLGPTGTSWDDTGNVYLPTAANGCSTPTTNCVLKDPNGDSHYGQGSVTGGGSMAKQTGSAYNASNWNPFSKTSTHYMLINGNYGATGTYQGTGAKKLSLPFVSGTSCPGTQLLCPYQVIRRPMTSDSTALSQSREYNLAQIHILLSDDPADLPGGAADANNVRLANIPANASGTGYNLPYGITMATGNYGAGLGLGSPSPNSYSLYFATASNGIPSGPCTTTYNTGSSTFTYNCQSDWPYPPAPWTAAMMTGVGAGTDPNCTLLCPTGAPFISNNGTTISGGSAPALAAGASTVVPPTLTLCPAASMAYTGGGGGSYAPTAIPAACTAAGATSQAAPYYMAITPSGGAVASSVTYTPANHESNLTSTWNLIDGWLRVEYLNTSGNWVPVTNEWLNLGFARGPSVPTTPGSDSINPNAILRFQVPADRVTAAPAPTASTAITTATTTPVCTAKSGGACTAWTASPAETLVDTAGSANWYFGTTTAAEAGAPTGSTLPLQSQTRFNWYPINFYDVREGEDRDTDRGNNSCTANGLMNAVEIDVGNLKKWFTGTIGASGTSVNSAAQNGYVLYYSDRRGMLPNPNYSTTGFVKTGDSGLEDSINANATGDGVAGTPDGILEPTPTGRTLSPEDVNENNALDNYGSANLGLSFYGTTTSASVNLNNAITAPVPDNPYTRIAACATARKNWVSGARHVLKLTDGSLGNVPISPNPVVVNGVTYNGGFSVASENPVYIQGDYNSNSGDTFFTGAVGATPGPDMPNHSAASVIADAVTILSNNWVDTVSTLGIAGDADVTQGQLNGPPYAGNRIATTTYYRVAVAGGKNIAFPFPSWENAIDYGFGTDGGIHNFLRFEEDWGGQVLNYGGSLVSLYYATYNTGVFKCCEYTVYSPPTRNYLFDNDFTVPAGLPPGTPMFRDVESLGYRQVFMTRASGQ